MMDSMLQSIYDMDNDNLYILYRESMSKLKNKDIDLKERKVHVMRVMMIRSIISDRYSLKLRYSTPDFDNPMDNPDVNRFFK